MHLLTCTRQWRAGDDCTALFEKGRCWLDGACLRDLPYGERRRPPECSSRAARCFCQARSGRHHGVGHIFGSVLRPPVPYCLLQFGEGGWDRCWRAFRLCCPVDNITPPFGNPFVLTLVPRRVVAALAVCT